MNDAEVKLQVKIDDSTASKSIDKLTKKTDGLAKSFTKAGKKLTAGLTVPIVAFGTLAIKNASDLSETMNKVDVAFGDSSDSVKEWGKTTIKQFGIAKGTALDMVALYGDMATGMGMNTTEASKLSTNLAGLAGDLASFKNISLDVAKTALAGVFTGETESLKQLGIVMTETNLSQFALDKGYLTMDKTSLKYRDALNQVEVSQAKLKDTQAKYGKSSLEAKTATINLQKSQERLEEAATGSTDSLTQQEKIQLRYAYVTEMSKNAVGDFARTSDSTANQTRIAQETFKELSAEIGEKLIPQFNKMLSTGLKIMDWFKNLNDDQKNMIITIAKIIAVLGPALIVFGKMLDLYSKFKKYKIGEYIAKITKHVWEFNSALLANPTTWIVLGIVALIAIIILCIKYWDEISAVVGKVFNAIGGFFSNLFSAIGTFFSNVWNAIVSFMTPIVNFIWGIIQKIISWITLPYKILWNVFLLIVALVAMGIEWIYNLIMPIVMWIYNTILLPIFNFFVSVFTTIINFIAGAIETIKNVFLTIVGFIWNNILSPIFNFFASIFGAIWGVISSAIDKTKNGFMVVANFIKSIFQTVANFIGSIFGVIGNIIKAPINAVIGLINGVLKGLNKIKVPDWVPVLGGMKVNFPLIPKLATGTNMVQQEGLAYLHQGEAVVPKKYNPAIGGGNANMSSPVYVNVEVQQDKFGNYTNTIKTFSNGSKNSYNYGAS